MSYANPADRRDNRHKVSLNSTLNKIITKSAARARKQNATFLLELIEWAIENGAVEEIVGNDLLRADESSVA
ncbi:hypothetical protein IQ22_04238 [Pseudomonas duriflava]|uniref:Uncharacterized protein n=2 Tax=Pseudomonas TaxID=286 RepID=A0A562PUD6_9PSED|nr:MULTISPECIES: hypothetical protein [Pseudomonas]ENA37454.1 hypothetical protein HMPREF1487_04372 [Pseudomonas sp. HPB0071]QEU28818.1 hypothetical protein FOB45_13930 [Pseudomonas luteola]TWI48045.1 hypothetical protein IQ22_04238 [Pseudomonas duriflava]SPZ07580.1 Uncharacterised protein [Pseudomonas luteola]